MFSSVPKIMGERFMTLSGADAPINTFPHFFETLYRSGFYWEFLGWSQVLTSLLLMTQVYATLGAVAFFAISVNVFVITISYEFGGTPVITGLMLLANIFLLIWDYQKLKVLLLPDKSLIPSVRNHDNPFYYDRFWMYLGLVIFLTTVFCVILNGRNPMLWFLFCVAEGFSGWVYMKWKYRNQYITV